VFGQREAVKKLVSSLKRSDLGLIDLKRPRGIFLFIGESGVGKTALALELEKNLFFNTSSLLRFDMSEYSEKQSLSKLIGSPPGYVGHEEGGSLTEGVKRNPHSVVLFDEIEKADKEVLNILLQISDYGYLTDSCGRRVSFRNTIVIATSNVGTSKSTDTVGFEGTREKSFDPISTLKKYYKEEFINRFDEIIYFPPLERVTLEGIVTEKLDKLAYRLSCKGNTFTYTHDVVNFLVSSCNTKGLGARPLLRKVASEIEDKIIDLILKNKDLSGSIIEASVHSDKISISIKNTMKA